MQRIQWLIFACAWLISSCSGGPSQANLATIAADAGIKLSPSSRLLYEHSGFTDKTGFWVIRGDERFDLPGEREPTGSENVRLDLDKHLKPSEVGDLVDGLATAHSWRKDDMRYRGTVVHTSTGFFLRLERFAQP